MTEIVHNIQNRMEINLQNIQFYNFVFTSMIIGAMIKLC